MDGRINPQLKKEGTLSDVVGQQNFSKLNPNIQELIIQAAKDIKQKDGGWLGQVLGTHPTNASLHIGLILSSLLILLIIVDTYGKSLNLELVKIILPVITLYLGYIFGRNSN